MQATHSPSVGSQGGRGGCRNSGRHCTVATQPLALDEHDDNGYCHRQPTHFHALSVDGPGRPTEITHRAFAGLTDVYETEIMTGLDKLVRGLPLANVAE